MRSIHLLWRSAAVIAALAALTAGCAGPASTASPWAAEFEALRAKVEPDSLAARIIEDDQITEAEIRELYGQLESCVKDANVPYFEVETLAGDLGYAGWDVMSDDEAREIVNNCEKSVHTWDLLPVYNEISINPQHIDPDEAIVQCLIDKKVVNPSTTGAQYKAAEEWMEKTVFGDPNDPSDDNPIEYGMPLRKLPLIMPFEEAAPIWDVCSRNRIPY